MLFRERPVLIIIVCLHFALLLAMGLFRHWGHMNNLNDLGFFDQAVWGTLHGQWFLDTNNIFGKPTNWLGTHFNIFLLLFVPLYAILPAAEWFAIAQALALSVAAWPIFLLASRVHESERTGLLWAIIYMLNPFLLSAAAWDFHPVAIAVPFIAGALLAVEKKTFLLFMICCLFLLLIQEQFGLTVAGFGILWWLKHREWKRGLLLIGIGLLHTLVILGFIMPALSPTGSHWAISPSSQGNRYGWLGGSLFEILNNIVFHPISMLKTVLSMDFTIIYCVLLILPFLGFFFAAPIWLLPAIADFSANTLSSISLPKLPISYHSVTLVPILTVAAIYGARRIAPLLARATSIPTTILLLLSTLGLSYTLAQLPLPGALNFWKPVNWVQFPDPALKQIRELIAKHPSVSIQANVGPHFSQHPLVFRYPYKVGEADTLVLWLDSPTLRLDIKDGLGFGSLTHHLQMKPATYLASIECLLLGHDYGVVLWDEPWLVAAKGPKIMNVDTLIQNKLSTLRNSWQISAEDYAAAFQECSNK